MKLNYSLTILFSMVLLFSAYKPSQAQQIKYHTPAIELGGGVTGDGVLLYGGYVARMGHKKENSSWYLKATAFYETGSGKDVDYSTFGVDAAAGYTVLAISPSLSLNLKAGFTVAMDKLNTPLTETDATGNEQQNDHGTVKIGVLGGAEMQWMFVRKMSLVVGGDQRYLAGSETWGHVRWSGYAGLRYTLK